MRYANTLRTACLTLLVVSLALAVVAQQPGDKKADSQQKHLQAAGTSRNTSNPTAPAPSGGAARAVQPYKTKPIEEYHAQPITPVQGKPIQSVQGRPVQPVDGSSVRPDGGSRSWNGYEGQRAVERREPQPGYDSHRDPRSVRDGRRDVIVVDRAHPGHRYIVRQREYIVDHHGRHVFLVRDAQGRLIRRYMLLQGVDVEVDSLGRRIHVEHFGSIDRHYIVDDHGTRWDYEINDTGREVMIHRDFWGRVKERIYYPEMPAPVVETYNEDVPPDYGTSAGAYDAQPVQPYQAQTIQPYQAQPIQSYQAQPVQQYQAQPVQQYHAQPVEQYQAHPVQPYQGRPVQTDPGQSSAYASQPRGYPPQQQGASSGVATFFRSYRLVIPGVAYTVDNYAADTRTLVTSAGAVTRSSVRINPDHTYDWNSEWDGRVIHGNWTEQKGGIVLMKGEQGINWLLRFKGDSGPKEKVTVWDQNATWYEGTPLN